jgi:opacity protein-like surface antigen
MKKLILGAGAALLSIAPAIAATTVVEFKRDSGEVFVVTFDGEGGASMADGTQMTYTFDTETGKMCFENPDATTTCIIYAEVLEEPKAGDSVRYKIDGSDIEGLATIKSLEE